MKRLECTSWKESYMDIKAFKNGCSINEIYAEMHKQKAFVERYEKRMRENPSPETFEKLKSAKLMAAWCEGIIERRKRETAKKQKAERKANGF